MDSRVLQFLGLPQNSRNRVQSDLRRKKSLQGPVRMEVERRKEIKKDVNPYVFEKAGRSLAAISHQERMGNA